MQTLELCLTELVATGVVDYETAVDASLYPKDIPKPPPPPVGTYVPTTPAPTSLAPWPTESSESQR